MDNLLFAQFCDDIRQEDNGKWLLIGCYGDTMLLDAFPQSMTLRAFVTFDHLSDFSAATFRLSLGSGALISEARMLVAENPYENDHRMVRAQLPSPPFALSLSREDELVLEVQIGDEDWREAGRLKIEKQTVV